MLLIRGRKIIARKRAQKFWRNRALYMWISYTFHNFAAAVSASASTRLRCDRSRPENHRARCEHRNYGEIRRCICGFHISFTTSPRQCRLQLRRTRKTEVRMKRGRGNHRARCEHQIMEKSGVVYVHLLYISQLRRGSITFSFDETGGLRFN